MTARARPARGEPTAVAPMPPPLLSPAGDAALAALFARRPLLAFDFDGTLTPIVARAADVRLDAATADRLRRLAARWPVAIVTGRAVADVRPRLGFEPGWVIGSHGADDPDDAAATERWRRALDALRERLAAAADDFAVAGVTVEDKGASVALHYRLAPDAARAEAAIDAVLGDAAPGRDALHVFAGKQVVNATAAGAPDKDAAVRTLLARSGAEAAFFAGDDVNDEPVFVAAPADWVTVRVGTAAGPTRARYAIAGAHEMARVLDRLLAG